MKATPTPARIAVKTRIPTAYFRTVEFVCGAYDIPPAVLLQAEAYGQAETLVDCPFSVLERMDDETKDKDTREVTLQFCPEAHALLSRIAALLRRPLPELIHGLLCEAGWSLRHGVEAALRTPDGIHDQDMAEWVDQAIAFDRLAKRNRVHKKSNGWDTFAIEPPEKRQAKLALAVA